MMLSNLIGSAKIDQVSATTMPFHAILLKQNWANFTEVALFGFGRLHSLGVNHLQKTSQFKYNVFVVYLLNLFLPRF